MERILSGGGLRLTALGVSGIFLIILIGSALAGTFTSSPVPDTYEAAVSPNISFHVHNNDTSNNITLVNITFPSTLQFVLGSDYTNASGTSISNSSYNVTWSNPDGIIDLNQTIYLNASFLNMTAPGYYIFTVTSEFNDSSTYSESVNVTVQDTTAPQDLVLLAPTSDIWTNSSTTWVNFSFTELNPDICSYKNDSLYTNDSASTNYCNISVTGYPEGNTSFTIWLYDTSGNSAQNGTYYLGYDPNPPVANSLALIYNGSDVSGQSITTRRNVTIRVNATDPLSGVGEANASIYNETDDLVLNIPLVLQGGFYEAEWDTINQYFGAGIYVINISLKDAAGNFDNQANGTTLDIVGAPDLQVTGVDWYSSNSNPKHPTHLDNLTLNVTVSNMGDENFTNDFNVTAKVSTSYLGGTEKFRVLIDNSSLVDGGSTWFNVTFPEGNFTSNTLYYITLTIDPENSVDESLDTNNDYSFNISLGYNVSLEWANNGTQSFIPPSVVRGFHYTNLTFNISVRYANGDPVTGLNFSNNFTFSSTHGSEDDGELDSRKALKEQAGTGSGYYIFNFTITSPFQGNDGDIIPYVGPGILSVQASKGNYSGSAGLDYNLTSPKLVVAIGISSTTFSGTNFNYGFSLDINNNAGNSPASNVFFDEDDNWRYVSFIDFVNHDTVTPFTIAPGRSVEFNESHDDLYVRIVGADPDSSDSLEVWINYTDAIGNDFIAYDNSNFDVTSSSEEEETSTTGGAGAGDTSFDLELTLTDWEDEIQGYPGDSISTYVEVKNTGDITVVAKVSFTCEPVKNAAIAPTSKSLAVNTRQEFIISLDLDEDAELGEYDCKARAYVSASEEDYDEETVVLKVLATEEEVSEINLTYQNMSATLKTLMDRFALINKALVNDTNLTRVENLLKNANNTLQSILEAIEDGDFITAHELLESLQASLPNLEEGMDDLEMEQGMSGGFALSGTWFWAVIIIVVVIAVAFMAYLLFPQKGLGPRKSLFQTLSDSLRGGASRLGSAKDSGKSRLGSLSKKDFKPSSYSGGYRKQQVTGYQYKGEGVGAKIKGAVEKLKEKLRRKKPQKEVTSYFKSSSAKFINYR